MVPVGGSLASTIFYADEEYDNQDIAFTYAHTGYITNLYNGTEHYTFVTWDEESIGRQLRHVGGDVDRIARQK